MSIIGPWEVDRLLLASAQEANVLPITSRCDSRCVFCSHRNNPPGIATVFAGARSLEEIKRIVAFLDPDRPIIIGESATLLIEGEPFSHPAFREILSLVRRVHPSTPLEITSNGRFLTAETVGFLETLGHVFLNVSVNSASARGRRLLMGDTETQSERVIEGVRLLSRSSVSFAGSLVAMPNLTGWDDIRDTIQFLADNGALAASVVMPAFSALADRDIFPDGEQVYGELREFVGSLSAELPCPVLVEPSCVSDLTPAVSGVLKGSPAWDAGIRRNDVLIAVNGRKPTCRVEAWNMLRAEGEIKAEVERDGRVFTVRWANGIRGDPGVTMEYDFDPARAQDLRRSVMDYPGKSVLLASELGHVVVGRVLESMSIGPDRAEVVMVRNHTFGGTIRAAGLLTVDDYLECLTSQPASRPERAQIILPRETFDSHGRDLKRRHFSELQEQTGVPVLLR